MTGGVAGWLPLPGGGVSDLGDLGDVDTTTTPPTDGQALVYDSGSGLWVPGTVSGGSSGGTIDALPFTRTWAGDVYDGVFQALGTDGFHAEYEVPCTTSNVGKGAAGRLGRVVTSQSSNQDATRVSWRALDRSLDATTGCAHTQSAANSWWKVDFGSGRTFTPTHVGLRSRNADPGPGNWKLQGSADNSTWTDLLTVTATSAGSTLWNSQPVVGASGYRYLRIYQTVSGFLIIGELEMWGTLA